MGVLSGLLRFITSATLVRAISLSKTFRDIYLVDSILGYVEVQEAVCTQLEAVSVIVLMLFL